MKFIDWFAGIGGFREGMEQAGHTCVGFCEFNKFAYMSYVAMHCCTKEQLTYIASLPTLNKRQEEICNPKYRNGEWYAKDVKKVFADDIPYSDCWCFGFPCQDISVAGKQLGFTGSRSSLFFRIMRLLEQMPEDKKPGTLLIENVKNLLSINGGWDFARLLIALDEGGYDAEWQILNSKDFGVPQNRERVFIIGHLRGHTGSEIFLNRRTDEQNQMGYSAKIERVGKYYNKNGKAHQRSGISSAGGIAHCLTATDYKEVPKVAIPILSPDRANKRQNGRRCKENGDPMFTLTTEDRHGVIVKIGDAYPNKYGSMQGRIYHPDGIAPTLRTPSGGGAEPIIRDKYVVRKLTPLECFRLQGWSDDKFKKAKLVNSDVQLYKQAGNGVTVTVIKAIAKGLTHDVG